MAVTLALFPVLLNALQGFLTVDRDRLEFGVARREPLAGLLAGEAAL